jgi:hypothetical protein
MTGHVEYIKGDVYSGRTDIVTFSVSDAVDFIEADSFRGCYKVKSLEGLGNAGVVKIGKGAFFQCGLTTLEGLPPSVSEFGSHCFARCCNLVSLKGLECTSVVKINNFAFAQCSKLTDLHGMPTACDTVGKSAFWLCTGIESLEGMPSTVKGILDGAFRSCTGLATLSGLSPAVRHIGNIAFNGCVALASLGGGFHPQCDVDDRAFTGCDLLVAAAAKKGYSSVEEWGKAVWRVCNLRWAVVLSVQSARRLLDEHGDEATESELLKLLASVPSGDDNHATTSESQVLRRIVMYVGTGFSY